MSSASGSGARRRSVAPGGGSAASPVVKSSYGAPPDSSTTRQSPVRRPSPSRSAVSGRSGASRTGGGVGTSNGRGGGGGGSRRNVGDSDEDEMGGSGSEASYDDRGNGPEPAAVRYARLKQRNQNTIGKNKVNGSSLNNTSVNIATAFNQAAGSSRSLHLSSASENERNPRKESHSPLPQASSSARRDFAMPPPPPRTNNNNQYHPPQPQPDRRERARSPVLDAIAGAARALSPVSYLLKPRVGVMNNQFPEDHEEEDDDEGPSYRSFGSALTSPIKSRANISYNHHENASFLSATTANTSNGGGASAESSYRFEEEERLMKEIEQSKGKGKEKEVDPPVASGSGWLSGLPGFSRSSPAPSSGNSPKKKAAPSSSKDSSYNPRATSLSEESASSESDEDDSDEFDVGQEDQVTKTSSKRRPRVSHDNQTFQYKPGQSASEESESDGDGGRQKRKKRKSGKFGPLGAEGMVPVVEGKKRKGKKGKRSTTKSGASRVSSDDEQEHDISMDLPQQPQQDQSYDDDATMDFGNDNGHVDLDPRGQEEDDSFVVQMSSKAAAAVRGPATTSSNSKLPTHFKSSKQQSFAVVALDLLLSALRYLLVGLILTFNALVTSVSWLFRKPAKIASGLARSLGLLDWSLASKTVAAAILLGTLAILLDQPTAPANGVVRPPSESSSWIPSVHFNRYSGGKAYRTPDLPPESMDELIERLAHLETALGSLTSQAQKSDAKRTQVESHVVQLQDRLSSDIKKVSTEAEKREHAEKERLQNLDRVVGKIRGDVDTLSGRVKKMGDQVESDAKEIERLDDGAEGVRKELKSLGERVREAEKVAKEASDASRIARIATEAIESYLPSKLVVRMNPKTGSLDIDPSFWKALRAVFVEHGQVEPIVSSRIDQLKSSIDASTSSVAKSSSPPPSAPVASVVVPQIPSWKEFLSSNEKALRAWSDSEHDRKADSGAVVSKKTFLEVLHRELESLKVTFEKQVNENIHRIGEDILSKSVAAGKAAAAVAHSGSKSSSSSSSSRKGAQTVTIKSSSGENISDLLTTMIDSALLKFSKDVLAKTDYALFTAGGRVIPSITTDTYEIKIKAASTWGRLVGGKKAATTIEGRAPAYALDPDIGVGNCWPFAGSKGQLGILLARKVLVTEITIEHAARAVSFDMDAAPRDVEVWGMVEGAENQAKVAAYQAQKAEELANLPPGSEVDEPVASLPPSPNYILLGSFAYDIDSPNHRQTFAVPDAIKELQVPTGIVVVRIGSNYGADYTCLYRVRVHGDALEHDASSSEAAA